MTFFLQQIITGISIGGIYALLAVGFALIYSVFDFSNFAFGCVMMASAFTCYYSIVLLDMSFIPAVLLSILAGIILSLLIEFLAYRPLRKKGTNRLFLMITGMGVDLAITNTATVKLGANARCINVESISTEPLHIGSLFLSKLDVGALVIALISFAILYIFIYKTKAGLGIRASAYSSSIAGLMGINVNNISIIVFTISGMTAGMAGVFCGMKYAVLPTVGTTPALKAFIASVLGGLGSLQGAVVGGLFLGILETFVSGFVSSVYRDLVSYGVLILVLLFMPGGLMGKSNIDKI